MSEDDSLTDLEQAEAKLESLIPYDGTEQGEMWRGLLDLRRYHEYVNPEMKVALEKEILAQANWGEENLELVEVIVDIPASQRKYFELNEKE